MSDFCIIDSNVCFARLLQQAISNFSGAAETKIAIVDPSSEKWQYQELLTTINDQTKFIINAESRLFNHYKQELAIIDTIFRLRFIDKLKNPFILYSNFSPASILRNNPQNLIIFSPGCYLVQMPLSLGKLFNIINAKPLTDLHGLQQFIYPKIKDILDTLRHKYANYASMAMMLAVAKGRHRKHHDKEILDGNALKQFKMSLEYSILKSYYELNFKGLSTFKDVAFAPETAKIFLIDDLANEGWSSIIGQMIYGNPNAPALEYLDIPRKANHRIDFDKMLRSIDDGIKKHKPHLILLDLKLDDEPQNDDFYSLSGFRILQYLSTHKQYKSVPIIMFTATTNAENVKKLLTLGAAAVWTKPGIDQISNHPEIIERYDELISTIHRTLNPDETALDILNDRPGQIFIPENLNFENLRNLLFRKLDFIKYRLMLFTETEKTALVPNDYRTADMIYVDCNTLLTGTAKIDFKSLISTFVTLSILTANSGTQFLQNPKLSGSLPKVVVLNSIFDEVLKLSKIGKMKKMPGSEELSAIDMIMYRAMITQFVLKNLFNDQQVRTELTVKLEKECKCSPRQRLVETKLMPPKENVVADGYFLDEVSDIVVCKKGKHLLFNNNVRLLVITEEKKLTEKLQCFNDKATNNLIIKSNSQFIEDFSALKI